MSANEFLGTVIWSLYTAPNSTLLYQPVAFITMLVGALQPTELAYLANITGTDVEYVNTTLIQFIGAAQYVDQVMSKPAESTTNGSTNGSIIISTCQFKPHQGFFTNMTLVPAFLIILLFMFLNVQESKRKRCCRSGCYRPGICVPVNMVDNYENRLGFACAFGTTVAKLLNILLDSDFSDTFDSEIQKLQKDPETPGWTGILWKLLAMFIIGISHYPYFACMSTPYKLVGAIIGFFYSLMWLIVYILWSVQCWDSNGAWVGVGYHLPTFLCLIALNIKYLVLIVKIAVRKSQFAVEKYEEMEWKSEYKYKYVMKLLQPIPKSARDGSITMKEKIKAKMYKWKPEFKYSTRVVCTYFVGLIAIYQIFVLFAWVISWFRLLVVYIEKYETELKQSSELMAWIDYKTLLRIARTFYGAWIVALVLATVVLIALVANMLSWYRGHLSRLQRGERNFLPIQLLTKTPSSITVAGMKYSGYQIAYLVWGFLMIHLLLFAIATVIGVQLFYPMIDGTFDSFLWLKFFQLWPTIVLSLIFYFIQFLLAKYVFLYDRGQTLALDNRQLFHVTTYFSFFFNVFIGVISCLKRILIGAVLGVVFLARTQKSLVSRDYELYDPGFNAYVGYLYLEHTHANPVLVTFCQLLINAISGPRIEEKSVLPSESVATLVKSSIGETSQSEMFALSNRRLHYMKARNRWCLFVTLLNNPSLKAFRRSDKYQHKSAFAALNIMVKENVGSLMDGVVNPLSSLKNEGTEYKPVV